MAKTAEAWKLCVVLSLSPLRASPAFATVGLLTFFGNGAEASSGRSLKT
jgi:hypothetical protein